MRGLLATSIGVTCAAALALPLTPPANAATVRPAPTAEAATTGTTRATSPDTATTGSLPDRPELRELPELPDRSRNPDIPDIPDITDIPDTPDLPGSTQSLPLAPLGRDRALAGAAVVQGLPRRDVRHFSLLGVVWDDPAAELHGRVQVRIRRTGADAWSGWQDVETHNADHGADPGTAESASGRVRGATAPLWVGDSDGVEVRVHPDTERRTEDTARGAQTLTATAPLPSGLHLELVDPGAAPPAQAQAGPPHGRALTTGTRRAGTAPEPPGASQDLDDFNPSDPADPVDAVDEADATDTKAATGLSVEAAEASAANVALAPLGAEQIPALDRADTERELLDLRGAELTAAQRAKPYIGPRPSIVTRRGWGADEKLRESGFRYTTKVKAAFVHHTASGNGYSCSQAPSVIRGIYRYHVRSMGWRDIGYNFLVDKCGRIYEGRAGGVAKPVLGAHTLGFNSNSMGIAVLGTFTSAKPNSATVNAVARLTAWKLGLFGANPKGKTYLTSGGGNLYAKGRSVRLNVISGHRDGFATECPGRQLYGKLGSARSTSAGYQGR